MYPFLSCFHVCPWLFQFSVIFSYVLWKLYISHFSAYFYVFFVFFSNATVFAHNYFFRFLCPFAFFIHFFPMIILVFYAHFSVFSAIFYVFFTLCIQFEFACLVSIFVLYPTSIVHSPLRLTHPSCAYLSAIFGGVRCSFLFLERNYKIGVAQPVWYVWRGLVTCLMSLSDASRSYRSITHAYNVGGLKKYRKIIHLKCGRQFIYQERKH